ncbi:hypothetical protein GW860_05030 [bacterium]|nr:hypothetical protein [bacterium]NCP08246.1 hypothetical protein [bacterium]
MIEGLFLNVPGNVPQKAVYIVSLKALVTTKMKGREQISARIENGAF